MTAYKTLLLTAFAAHLAQVQTPLPEDTVTGAPLEPQTAWVLPLEAQSQFVPDERFVLGHDEDRNQYIAVLYFSSAVEPGSVAAFKGLGEPFFMPESAPEQAVTVTDTSGISSAGGEA